MLEKANLRFYVKDAWHKSLDCKIGYALSLPFPLQDLSYLPAAKLRKPLQMVAHNEKNITEIVRVCLMAA